MSVGLKHATSDTLALRNKLLQSQLNGISLRIVEYPFLRRGILAGPGGAWRFSNIGGVPARKAQRRFG